MKQNILQMHSLVRRPALPLSMPTSLSRREPISRSLLRTASSSSGRQLCTERFSGRAAGPTWAT